MSNPILTDEGVALVPVTIGDVTFPAGSTPQQRLEAHAKAGTQSQFHTDGNVMKFAQGDGKVGELLAGTPTGQSAATASPPPSPKELERQNAGFRVGPVGQRQAGPGIDHEAIELLTARYKALVSHDIPEESRARFTATFQRDLAALYDGKVLTEAQKAELRKTGNVETFVPKEKGAKAATSGAWSTPNADGSRTLTAAGQKMQADLLAEYNALPAAERGKAVTQRQYQEALYKTVANERGTVAAAHFMAKDLSGYQLPAGEYTPDVIHDLARARAIGLTQEQVERIIAAERA